VSSSATCDDLLSPRSTALFGDVAQAPDYRRGHDVGQVLKVLKDPAVRSLNSRRQSGQVKV